MKRFAPSLIGLLIGMTGGAMVIALVLTRDGGSAGSSVAPITIDSSSAPSERAKQKREHPATDRTEADEVEAPAPAKIEDDDIDEPDDDFDEPDETDDHGGDDDGTDDHDGDKDDHDGDNSGPGSDNSGPGGGDDGDDHSDDD